ncbi:lytic transglycosylase domain-containing protein [Micromonospora sp. NPDC049559]|uniref:aggregation-promoting factor C-terminal-like domain-containing protein n=1 Tax=Micromonospora sp. NPDC049559 TaxID=3155923 RepID=UPI003449BEC0
MSRLWSRVGVRVLAIALLGTGVGGGYYLGQDRETQQQGISAQLAADTDEVEFELQRQEHARQMAATAQQRMAEYEARVKAAEAAKAAAERARKAEEAAASRKRREAEEKAADKPYDGPIPSSCNQYSGNRKIGCAVMLNSGFGLDQFPCLDKLWNKESGWNTRAANPSGAYGIPQARPGNKMAEFGADWKTSAATQVAWGLDYIENRYGTPCKAWQHSEDEGWY